MCVWIEIIEESHAIPRLLVGLGLFFLVAMLRQDHHVDVPFCDPALCLVVAWACRLERASTSRPYPFVPSSVVSVICGSATAMPLQHHHSTFKQRYSARRRFLSRTCLLPDSTLVYYFSRFFPTDRHDAQHPTRSGRSILPALIRISTVARFVATVLLWVLDCNAVKWGRHALLGLRILSCLIWCPSSDFKAHILIWALLRWVMDHLSYIPMIGLIGLTVAALGQIDEAIRN